MAKEEKSKDKPKEKPTKNKDAKAKTGKRMTRCGY